MFNAILKLKLALKTSFLKFLFIKYMEQRRTERTNFSGHFSIFMQRINKLLWEPPNSIIWTQGSQWLGARSGGSQLRKFTTKPSGRSLPGPSTWLMRTTSSNQSWGAGFCEKEQCGLGKMDKLWALLTLTPEGERRQVLTNQHLWEKINLEIL